MASYEPPRQRPCRCMHQVRRHSALRGGTTSCKHRCPDNGQTLAELPVICRTTLRHTCPKLQAAVLICTCSVSRVLNQLHCHSPRCERVHPQVVRLSMNLHLRFQAVHKLAAMPPYRVDRAMGLISAQAAIPSLPCCHCANKGATAPLPPPGTAAHAPLGRPGLEQRSRRPAGPPLLCVGHEAA